MSGWTEGPWTGGERPYHANEVRGVDPVDGKPQIVATVYGYSQEQVDANVELIKAALPMMKALEDLVEWLWDCQDEPQVKAARAALAKAGAS